MSNQFSADEQLVGYLYQIRYALLAALQKIKDEPGIEISIEKLDDVAFEKDGEAIELLQTKHHINQTATLSDSCPDLWKTLRVWSIHIVENPRSIDDLTLFLITTARAVDSSLASKLRRDDNRDEEHAFQRLKHIAETSRNATNSSAYTTWLSLSEEQQKSLINKIVVIDSASSIKDANVKILREMHFSSRYPEALSSRIQGWWFERTIEHLTDDDDLGIKGLEITKKIYDIQETLGKENLPNDFPVGIFEMNEEELDETERIFIEQLRLILLGNTRLRIAIGDYYRAFQQRTRWLSEGLIYPRELEVYEDYLVGEWRREFELLREELAVDSDETDLINMGKAVFNWTQSYDFKPIRQNYFDAYFSRGSYQILANTLKIGWHPDFASRLGRLIGQAVQKTS